MTPADGHSEDRIDFDRLLQLIGRLNYTWTNTESLLIHLIAGLSGTDKETAVIVFLTLNSSRARMDLVERLAKLDRVPDEERAALLGVTARMTRLAGLRNRYNHCIYSFDPDSGNPRTILMRIADRKDRIKVGQMSDVDDAALDEIAATIRQLGEINTDVWKLVARFGYPT